MPQLKHNQCILFDGLTYNTHEYFASCVVFFRGPQGRGKIRAMSKNVREYYKLNHRIRDLLFHYKKVLFCFNFIERVFFLEMHHLSFRARVNDVKSTKSQPKVLFFFIG